MRLLPSALAVVAVAAFGAATPATKVMADTPCTAYSSSIAGSSTPATTIGTGVTFWPQVTRLDGAGASWSGSVSVTDNGQSLTTLNVPAQTGDVWHGSFTTSFSTIGAHHVQFGFTSGNNCPTPSISWTDVTINAATPPPTPVPTEPGSTPTPAPANNPIPWGVNTTADPNAPAAPGKAGAGGEAPPGQSAPGKSGDHPTPHPEAAHAAAIVTPTPAPTLANPGFRLAAAVYNGGKAVATSPPGLLLLVIAAMYGVMSWRRRGQRRLFERAKGRSDE